MARRKRKEEEPDWVAPEFDDVAFMRKEIENAKIAVAVVAWAAVGAILGTLLYALNPAVGFVLGLATFGALYFLLPLLRLPVHGYKPRDWVNRFGTYFFCWLAFFILLLNPPFSDHTAPSVQFVMAATYPSPGLLDPPANSAYCVPVAAGATVSVPLRANNTLYVLFRATDNVRVQNLTVRATAGSTSQDLTPAYVGGTPTACSNDANSTVYAPGTYAVKMSSTGIQVTFGVTATDAAGLSAAESFVLAP